MGQWLRELWLQFTRRHDVISLFYAKWVDCTGQLSKKHILLVMLFGLVFAFAVNGWLYKIAFENNSEFACNEFCGADHEYVQYGYMPVRTDRCIPYVCNFNFTQCQYTGTFWYPFSDSVEYRLCAQSDVCWPYNGTIPCITHFDDGTNYTRAQCGLLCSSERSGARERSWLDQVGTQIVYFSNDDLMALQIAGFDVSLMVVAVKWTIRLVISRMINRHGISGGRFAVARLVFGAIYLLSILLLCALAIRSSFHYAPFLLHPYLSSIAIMYLVTSPLIIVIQHIFYTTFCSRDKKEEGAKGDKRSEEELLIHQVN